MRARIISLLTAAALAAGTFSALPVCAASSSRAAKTTAAAKAASGVTINSVMIQGGSVVVTTSGAAATDDGLYHLYAQDPVMAGVQGTEVAKAPAGATAVFTFPLGNNTAASMLYKKFTVVGVSSGALKDLSNDMYILNPEAAATHTQARHDVGKKGLLPAAETIRDTKTLKAMGVHQISYNLPVGDMISGGGVNYTYNGKNYSFNAGIVGQYDVIVPAMNAAGIQVNLILLCGANSGILIHPLSRGVGANYYMFNTVDQAGLEKLEAVAAFLGQRYSGTGHGTVDNWIVGNEVNARNEWNYMDPAAGLAGFAKAYADELRVFYNGIKSQNANARIYAATDQEWQSDNPALHYGSREFLTQLNAQIMAEGNFDWSLASHPYNFPLYEPNSLTSKPQVTHTQASRYITMSNIDVLTDFMCQKQFLNPAGQVRSIVLSEVGFTSSAAMGSNELLQAADVVYAINQANANQHIDGIIINRQRSDISEIAQGLDYGLIGANGVAKQAYTWFMTAENPNTIAAASAVLGKDIMTSLVAR